MKIKNLFVLLLIAVCSTVAFAGGGGESGGGNRVLKGLNDEYAGFEEFPLGDNHELGPLNVAGVYLQPVDIHPAAAVLPASQSDMHMKADISALKNGMGYGVGDFVPSLTVEYKITKSTTGEEVEGMFMSMNASDSPYYGANVKLPGDGLGTYTVRFTIQNPEAQDYVLDVDEETGVSDRFWETPLVAEWTVDYDGLPWAK
jgi:uncharacterized protein involved in high-affinity Fe2+ transport